MTVPFQAHYLTRKNSKSLWLETGADPASKFRGRGAISMIFGSQVSLQVHYCKRDEAYFITLLWQKMDDKVALYRECCFPNCSKSWQKKLHSEVLGGAIVPIATPRIRPFAEAGCETCERIVLLLIFISQQYRGNESSKVHFKLRYLCVLPHVTVELRHPSQV